MPTQLNRFPKDREIVFYCTHLDEAAATRAAKKLMDLGYPRMRPLLGGLDAWIAAKYEVEFQCPDLRQTTSASRHVVRSHADG